LSTSESKSEILLHCVGKDGEDQLL
jgi:hypothetical protein